MTFAGRGVPRPAKTNSCELGREGRIEWRPSRIEEGQGPFGRSKNATNGPVPA